MLDEGRVISQYVLHIICSLALGLYVNYVCIIFVIFHSAFVEKTI